MTIPEGVPRVTVTTGPPLMAPGGTPAQGRILFVGPDLVVVPALDLTLGGAEAMQLTAGAGAIDLVPSDLTTMSPVGWTYEVRSAFTNAPNWVRWIRLTSGMGTVTLADVLVPDPVTGAFTVLVDPSTLGGAALLDVGTGADTVAAGDDPRFGAGGSTGALLAANNLSDLPDPAAARGHLGLGSAAVASAGAFDAAGAAGAAGAAAVGTAAADTTSKVSAHAAATDPHGDRASAAAALSSHTSAADPHGDRAAANAALSTHASASTSVHGIANTAALVTTADARLINARTPTAHAASHAAGGTDALTPAAIGAVAAAALDSAVAYPPSYRLPRYPQSAAILTEWQSGHGFTASGGTLGADTAVAARGTQCVRYVSPGDNATYNITGTVSSTDTTGRALRILVRVEDVTVLQSLDVQVAVDSSFASGWAWTAQGTTGTSTYLTSGDWVLMTLGFADATVLGAGARSGLTALRVRVRDTGAPVTVRLQAAELVADGSAAFPSGCVVITADDVYQSFVDLGAAKLDQYGYPVTAYVIADRVGLSGRLTLAEMQDRQATAGWELACHAYSDTVHGLTYAGVSAAQVDADARAMKAFAVINGFRGADLHALPKGATGRTTDGAPIIPILERYFATVATTVNKTREVFPPSDPFRVRRISAISSVVGGYAPATITGAGGDLDRIKANGGVLVLNFHQIVASPTDTSMIAQSDFNAIVDGIASRGIPVLTMGELMRYALTSASSGAAVDSVSIPKRAAAIGTPGVSTLAAPADHAHPRITWEAADHGLLTWVADPALMQNSQTPASGAGVLQLVRLHLPVAATVTNVVLYVSAAGVGLTSGQCLAGLYTTGGTLLSAVADQSTAWGSAGLKTMALGTPQVLAAGDYYVGWFANAGTTLPSFLRGVGSSAGNLGLAASVARFATGATGNTTAMPSSAGTLAGSSAGFWAALS